MSTSESGPPPQHPRRLVLRRKVPNLEGQPTVRPPPGTDSPALSTLSAPLLPSVLPPPAVLPRAERRIENTELLDESPTPPRSVERLFEARGVTPAERANQGKTPTGSVATIAKLVHATATAEQAAAHKPAWPSPPNPSAAPAPLPSHVSVLPFVASVSPDAAYETGRYGRPDARRRSAAIAFATGLVAVLVAVGALLGMRLQRQGSVERSAAAGQSLPAAALSPPVQTHAARGLPASEPAIPIADVNDLPKAPPIKRAVARPARPSVATPAGRAGPAALAEGSGALPSEAASASSQTSTAGGSPTVASGSASAEIELPEMPPAALPPVDPLVKAVQQSIDEARQKP
ncbi:MAG TPA: hypothetical protein VGY54_19755 [Polyangiaceae bacterium]|jgi:hypothetical protein|nr:hypothetical protein [Polyangiaceae bacterium]